MTTALITKEERFLRYGRPRYTLSNKGTALLATMVAEGTSTLQIAKQFGVSWPTIIRLIRDAELDEVRRKVGHHHGFNGTIGVAKTKSAIISQLSAKGATLEEIAQATGVTRERIRQILNQYDCGSIRWEAKRKHRNEVLAARHRAAVRDLLASPISHALQELEQISKLRPSIEFLYYDKRNAVPHAVFTVNGMRVRPTICHASGKTNPKGYRRYFRVHLSCPNSLYVMICDTGQRAAWWMFDTPRMVYLPDERTPSLYKDRNCRPRVIAPDYVWHKRDFITCSICRMPEHKSHPHNHLGVAHAKA